MFENKRLIKLTNSNDEIDQVIKNKCFIFFQIVISPSMQILIYLFT